MIRLGRSLNPLYLRLIPRETIGAGFAEAFGRPNAREKGLGSILVEGPLLIIR